MKRIMNLLPVKAMAILVFVAFTRQSVAQEIKFLAHADPLITWMSSNSSDYSSQGAKAGFDLGLNVLYYYRENFAASTGVSFLAAGGRQSAINDHLMVFNNFTEDVAPGEEMTYNLRYINIPLGVRFQTTPSGAMTYFTDIGLDIRALLKSTVDLPADAISDENAKTEVYGLNAGWHVYIGLDYELSMETSLVAGLGFDRDFFDVTKDLKNVFQPEDRSTVSMVRFRLGLKF